MAREQLTLLTSASPFIAVYLLLYPKINNLKWLLAFSLTLPTRRKRVSQVAARWNGEREVFKYPMSI
jgi:hypothetical protein